MALVIGAVLALLSVAVAVYPFARRRLGWDKAADTGVDTAGDGMPGAKTEDGADTASLEDIYAAIRTLQLERELGSIPEGLYREQLKDYRIQAALALRRQEQPAADEPGMEQAAAGSGMEQAAQEDDVLEREIRAARAGLRRAAAAADVGLGDTAADADVSRGDKE